MICTSVILRDSQPIGNSPDTPEPTTALSQPSADSGVVGKNSFARYLADQNTQTNGTVKNLQASAFEPYASVTNLRFDDTTGTVTAVTSQNYACSLRVTFIDEDNPSNTVQLEADVAEGNYVLTKLTADLSALPEYYLIQAQLVNNLGLAICDPYTIDSHTRDMQKILDTTAADFNADQVVNFDEDETTNFIVLSEDTVIAEHTGDTNTLVSADYDRNVYVFGHIDESIRTLEKGDFFYIQPTDEDIISIRVKDVDVDGSTATVTADPKADIGEMYEFIKIETLIEDTDSVTVSDPAWTEEFMQEYLSDGADAPGTFQEIMDQAGEVWGNITSEPETTTMKSSDSKKFKLYESDDETLKIEAEISYTNELHYNCYKDMTRVRAQFWTDFNLAATFTSTLTLAKGEAGSPYKIDPTDVNALRPKPFSAKKSKTDPHLFYKLFPTEIPGLLIEIAVDLSAELNMQFLFGWTHHMVLGIDYDSENGTKPITQIEPIKLNDNNGVQGEVKVETELSIGVSFAKIVSLAVGIGGELDITAKLMTVPKAADADGKLQSGSLIFKPKEEPDELAIHACDHGLDIGIDLGAKIFGKVGIGIELEGVMLLEEFNWEKELDFFEVTYHVGDFHVPINISGPYSNIKMYRQPCPNFAYKTTIIIHINNAPAGYTAYLNTDEDSYSIPVGNSRNVFYAIPGNHTYEVVLKGPNNLTGGKRTFKVLNNVQTITQTIEFSDDEVPVIKNNTVDVDEVQEVMPVEPPPVEEPELPSQAAEGFPDGEIMVEIRKLGKKEGKNTPCNNIIGILYRNGLLEVIGSGEMYNFESSPFKHIWETRVISIENSDPENGDVIANIGNNVFNGAKNAELLYLPDTIESIGTWAFRNCESLKYARYGKTEDTSAGFTLPPALKTIGNSAFEGCTNAAFGPLTIPASVENIEGGAFTGCNGMTSLNIPGNAEKTLSVFSGAFRQCGGLKKVVIGNGIKHFDARVFSDCYAIEDMTIASFDMNESLKWHVGEFFNVGYGVIDKDQMIEAYQINSLFYSPIYVPKSLKKFTFTDITTIPWSFFKNVLNLESVCCTKGVEVIDAYAFEGCANLKHIGITNTYNPEDSLDLPDTLKTIEHDAFNGCTNANFGTLIIPESVEMIGQQAFKGCNGLEELIIPGYTELIPSDDPNGDPVEKKRLNLGDYSFGSCKNLKKVVLGSGIRSINAYVFSNSSGIEEMAFSTDLINAWIGTRNLGRLFNSGYPKNPPENMYTTIGTPSQNADYYCVPNSLKKLTILDSSKLDYQFLQNIKSLESLSLPASLNEISSNSINNCEALSEVRMVGEAEDWEHIEIGKDNDALLKAAGEDFGKVGYDTIVLLADPEHTKVYLDDKATFYAFATSKYALNYLWQYTEDDGKTWKDTKCTEYKIDIDYKTLEGKKYRCIITDEKGNKLLTDNPVPVAAPTENKLGDVNGDSHIDVSDAILIARFVAEDPTVRISGEGKIAADVDHDGKLTQDDVVTILKYIAKLIHEFPAKAQ